MKSIFERAAADELISRINSLSLDTKKQWGRMDHAQMLAHCIVPMELALDEKKIKRTFVGYMIGGFVKSMLYNDKPYKQNMPTDKDFIVKGKKILEEEKSRLITYINKMHAAGPTGISKQPHPFFGKLKQDEWAMGMYKHIDHHLRQFSC